MVEAKSEISDELVRGYASLNPIVESMSGGATFADLGLLPETLRAPVTYFTGIEEGVDWLKSMHDRADLSVPVGVLQQARIRASIAYIEALIRKQRNQSQPHIDDYLMDTIGVKPELIPVEELNHKRAIVEDMFNDFGFSFNPAGFERLGEMHPLGKDKAKRLGDFRRNAALGIKTIGEITGRVVTPEYAIKSVEVDQPWINRTIGKNGKPILEVNTHTVNKFRWYPGLEENLALHEIATHLLQSVYLQEDVTTGLLDTTHLWNLIPGPDTWQTEGMAMVITHLVPKLQDIQSKFGLFANEYELLRRKILGNVLILANSGVSQKYIKDMIEHYAPASVAEADRTIELSTSNPRYRSFNYAYSDGARYLDEAALQLDPLEINRLVGYLYGHFLTPDQVKSFVSEQLQTVPPATKIQSTNTAVA